ncbi:MAG TPA: hypothetical protein VMA77_31255 [Solirubrobacteraceae bacterium]|nr:hypothetical protein [Solirubrobacteraceae bacterium]HUA49752.1 hypothetical protein [Solirubrobacteraceae bacterium]
MSATGKRILWTTALAAIVCVAIGLYIGLYLVNVPGSSAAVQTSSGTNLYLATVPAAALNDPHPTWVSYYAVDAGATNWRHVTTYTVPANTLVHVTIYNFDSPSGLRNPWFGQSSGTVGGVMTLDGKTMKGIDPDNASHVFSIPQIGLVIPLDGIAATAKNPCSNAPCSLSNNHTTTTFTFRTPGKGLYRWQCFVPCAAGYIAGFGGPMQTVGYMDGFIKVV